MYVLVDLGYLLFYRMHATLAYLSHRKEGNPEEMATMEMFENHLIAQLDKLKKKAKKLFGQVEPVFLFCQDERQHVIWRMKVYPDYKGNRAESNEMVRSVRKIMLKIVAKYGTIYKSPGLEADDIAYLLVKEIRKRPRNTTTPILIITSDRDYLQMKDDYITIMDGSGKEIKGSDHGATIDLLIKVLMGDTSDNIPPVAKGVGKKTAANLAIDSAKLAEFIKKKACQDTFERNKQLIDMSMIPKELVDAFLSELHIP